MDKGLSFDDILIKPRLSNINSRKDISLKTKLTKNITLNIPIVSSPMDTVTEDNMAISLAMQGGLGIVHRFQSVEDQVAMIKNVKRHLSYVINNPYTIREDETIDVLQELMSQKKVSGILVVDSKYEKFVGIVSKRDLQIHSITSSNAQYVSEIMTPKENVVSIKEYNYDNIINIFKNTKRKKIPIVDENGFVKGLVVLRNLLYFHENKQHASLDSKGRLLVGAAIGINGDYMERAEKLIEADVDILCIDVANGYNTRVGNVIGQLKKAFPDTDLMVGNVCTREGFEYLCKYGVDCIRVGIGNGSICTTRLETGVGVCQFSALLDCNSIAKQYGVSMISDGGHCGKNGNKFKALTTGASAVMLGKSLAGTSESPGNVIFKNGRRYKYYRGMASAYANLSKQERQGVKPTTDFHVEGVEGEIEYKGSVVDIVKRMTAGMKSGMSYLGVKTIDELHKINVEYTLLTQNGVKETMTRI